MIFKDEKNLSFYPKCLFMAAISLVTLLAGHLMFNDAHDLPSWLKLHAINGDFHRQILLIFCLWLYVLRLGVTVFVFLKRKMEWSEMLIVTCLMSFALFSFAKVGGNSNKSVGNLDYLSLCLYLLGSWLNTYSEYTRYVWKNKKENQGYLYTQGLFKFSMHINYFGDIVLFTGLALLTLHFSMLFIPFFMAMNFIFFIIPRLDNYLSVKYGKRFEEYAGQTKKFIPGIY